MIEDPELVAGLGDVDDDDSLVDVHLGGRQPDARRRVHRLGHVADELLDLRGEGRDGGRDLLEAGIRVFEDQKMGHVERLACQMHVPDAESSLSPYFAAV